MAFHAERVRQTECPSCGASCDVAEAQPLSQTTCPRCGAEMTVPAKVGSMRVTRLIGTGTGSIVYAARDRVLGRDVALKVLKNRDPDNPGKQSGIDEARALLLVSHPNVIKVHAIDTRRGDPCIIMELLPGPSLKDLIESGQTLGEARALEIAIGVARGLRETSRQGLLHLDVKPGNIMFDAGGTPKLLDFGFAAVGLEDYSDEIIGTPYYVSPELVRQEDPDLRADIYSLGATLYHALTGEPPFDDDDLKKLIVARLRQPPPNPRDLRPDLHEKTAAVLRRMMAPDLGDRHQDYTTLLRDLRAAQAEAGSAGAEA